MKYWLIKSEEDCYSIDTLRKDMVTPWSGVRNFQARNFMRDDMKIGDKALFYHSNSKLTGVVGVAEVCSLPYPDPTAFDVRNEHFDPKSKREKPTWILVDFKFLKKFKMSKLRRHMGANTPAVVETKSLKALKAKTGNLYESISIIAKRANQINISIREELHSKLEEFASHTDSLEEIHENKEQIEISKAYERMPNPAILATAEFIDDKIYYRKNEETDLFR